MSKNKIPKDLVKYIEIKNDFFYVKRKFNEGIVKYGKFNSLDKALAAVHLLIKHNWKLIDVEDDPLINYGGKFWIFQVVLRIFASGKSVGKFRSFTKLKDVV